MVKINIDGQDLEVNEGITILEAAKIVNIKIPTLCHHEDQKIKAVCRICAVEIEGQRLLQTACSTPVANGMVIKTNSPTARKARRNNMELLLAHHPQSCLTCAKNSRCELQSVANDINMNQPLRFEAESRNLPIDRSSTSLIHDPNKCILCGRCVEVCSDVQSIGVFSKENRGYETVVAPAYGKKLADTACVNCGQCVQVCPTSALIIKDAAEDFYTALVEGKHIVAQVSPSVRITIAEGLGEAPGTVSTGRMVTALKKLGFHKVFDADFSADLTIMEEGNELLHRIQNGGVLPMVTSCCPGWVKFCETFAPKYLKHLSSAKSPLQMFGPLIKTYYAEKAGIDPENIRSVSVTPCTAKKYECDRPEMNASGYRDIDFSFTVVEIVNMIRASGIDFSQLEDTPFDDPFGLGSGAGEIFGATGGVMEAALRTVYEVVTKKELPRLEFEDVRGIKGLKETQVDLDGTIVKVAVVHGLGNAREILRRIKKGTADYHFIEVMACPGGCIGGGGNPKKTWNKVRARIDSVYDLDKKIAIRKSHENPEIHLLYKEFLDAPLSEKSHHLLHTSYTNRQDLLR